LPEVSACDDPVPGGAHHYVCAGIHIQFVEQVCAVTIDVFFAFKHIGSYFRMG
jgi:hypothetical protein